MAKLEILVGAEYIPVSIAVDNSQTNPNGIVVVVTGKTVPNDGDYVLMDYSLAGVQPVQENGDNGLIVHTRNRSSARKSQHGKKLIIKKTEDGKGGIGTRRLKITRLVSGTPGSVVVVASGKGRQRSLDIDA